MNPSKSRDVLFGALVASALALPVPAFADAHSEIVLAATHAGLAASATDIASVHSHLHHALNCLVGPSGLGFDAKEMNPCAQSGKGAIPDTVDAAKKTALEAAVVRARSGAASPNLDAARKAASVTAAALKKLE